MGKITLKMLEEAKPGSVIATGEFDDIGKTSYRGTGKKVMWVAVRGRIPDWAVYIDNPRNNFQYFVSKQAKINYLKKMGMKVGRGFAELIVPIGKGVIDKYRN